MFYLVLDFGQGKGGQDEICKVVKPGSEQSLAKDDTGMCQANPLRNKVVNFPWLGSGTWFDNQLDHTRAISCFNRTSLKPASALDCLLA